MCEIWDAEWGEACERRVVSGSRAVRGGVGEIGLLRRVHTSMFLRPRPPGGLAAMVMGVAGAAWLLPIDSAERPPSEAGGVARERGDGEARLVR